MNVLVKLKPHESVAHIADSDAFEHSTLSGVTCIFGDEFSSIAV